MFMSVVELKSGAAAFGDLAGTRVLVTGVSCEAGVDVARAFAGHKARLIVQTGDDGPEITEIAAMLSKEAAELKLFTSSIKTGDEATRLAQHAAQAFGGLDTVVNVVRIEAADFANCESEAAIEAMLTARMLPLTMITKVAANRMRLTLAEGVILNVVICPQPATSAEAALIGVIRATLACLTRREAQEWSAQGIRINAIGPRGGPGEPTTGAVLAGEPDIAALSLHLASRQGRTLTGHVFDAELVIDRE